MKRRPALEIGDVLIDIPDWLKKEAASYNDKGQLTFWDTLRDDTGVAMGHLGSVVIAACNAFCDWHDDAGITYYTALLVIRDDCGSWVETRGTKVQRQPPGTVMLLDVRKQHRLNCSGGRKAKPGVWLAVAIDYNQNERPIFEDCVERLKREIQHRDAPKKDLAKLS